MHNESTASIIDTVTESSIETADDDADVDNHREELIASLQLDKKFIAPKFFYDEQGSALFDQITRLPEYYPTRTETQLLEQYGQTIAAMTGTDNIVYEPGAGGCEKARLLLQPMTPACYVPADISAEFLFEAADKLQKEFPDVPIYPQAVDMHKPFQLPPECDVFLPEANNIVFYPGSTIGNLYPQEAVGFLKKVDDFIGDDGGLLIGVDLEKDPQLLHQAYNDSQGITAQFNKNMLNHVNKILDSDIAVEEFDHVAFYNEDLKRIEMHLECKTEQTIDVGENVQIQFLPGERIHTECSYKYSVDSFADLAAQAGLKQHTVWVDDNQWFSLQYLVRD